MSDGAPEAPPRRTGDRAAVEEPVAGALAAIEATMRAGRFAAAARTATALLDDHPENPRALHCLAACQRYLGERERASRTLATLAAAHPRFARGWQERGHLARDAGNVPAAVSAYEQAVRLNPALPASWHGLAEFAPQAGRHDLAGEAARHVRFLESLPAQLRTVASLTHEGRLYRAERLCRDFLRRRPRHVEGMRLLAAVAVATGILDDAEFLLESAVSFEPQHRGARLDYINVLHRRQKFRQSLAEAERLLRSDPADPVLRLTFANQSMAAGDFDSAIEVYDDIAAVRAGTRLVDETLHLTRGHALKTAGRLPEAIDAYRTACTIRPDYGDAYWSLANLKTYRFTGAERVRLETLAAAPETTDDDRVHVLFALAKACEDAGQYGAAFSHYARGNRLRRGQLDYDAAEMTARLRLQATVCTAAFFRERAGSGCPSHAPIFIVGLPRAGSTLLEQILASHSAVDGTLELHHVGAFAQKIDGRRRRGEPPRYPARLADLDLAALRQLGERYLEETAIHRRGAPFFVDKMPNNFRHIGLIHLVLPNARIIDARREPLACCFSNFKQLFASGQEFSYDLADVGRYYSDYVDLMDHWDRVLPGKVLRVRHEDVVADLEGQVRRLLAHCGLPFETGCLRYYETDRAIRTPSSEQVRRPIYADGLAQWRNFEPWLDPLKQALGGLAKP